MFDSYPVISGYLVAVLVSRSAPMRAYWIPDLPLSWPCWQVAYLIALPCSLARQGLADVDCVSVNAGSLANRGEGR